MNKDLILDALKKNMVSVICGVVALIAVVAAFYPIGGMNQELQDGADARAGKFGTLSGLLTKNRVLPDLTAGTGAAAAATPVALKAFPNPDVIKQGEEALGKLTIEGAGLMAKLQEQNGADVHRPLVDKVLPTSVSDFPKVDYREVYKLVLSTDPRVSMNGKAIVPNPVQADPSAPDAVVTNDRLAGAGAANLCNDVLHATLPPSLELIKARTDWVSEHVFAIQVVTKDGHDTNEPLVRAKFEKAKRAIPDQLKMELALSRQVYLDADAFQVNPEVVGGIGGGTGSIPSPNAIWYSQVQLWIQQDVARAVAEANGPQTPKGVLDSAVKRVVRLQLNPDNAMLALPIPTAGGGGGANGGFTGPVPAAETETGKLPVQYAVSPTGRVSNGMYDVVPFRLVLDVDAAKVNQVLQTLSNNRLISITGEDVRSIDSLAFFGAGFVYGSVPVVRLTLTGEELMLRSWTVPLMPPTIKWMLGLPGGTPPVGGAGMPGGGGMPPMGGGGGMHSMGG